MPCCLKSHLKLQHLVGILLSVMVISFWMLAILKPLIMSLTGKNHIRLTWLGKRDTSFTRWTKSSYITYGIVTTDLLLEMMQRSLSQIKSSNNWVEVLLRVIWHEISTVWSKETRFAELFMATKNIEDTMTKSGVWICLEIKALRKSIPKLSTLSSSLIKNGQNTVTSI